MDKISIFVLFCFGLMFLLPVIIKMNVYLLIINDYCNYDMSYGIKCYCVQQNFENVPQYLLRDITHMDLSLNAIVNIEQKSFKYYDKLETLNLQSNNISFIEKGSFEHLRHLRTLILRGNEILQFNQRLPSLHTLDLSNNPLLFINIAESQIKFLSLVKTSLGTMPNLELLAALEELDLTNSLIDVISLEDIVPLCSLKRLKYQNSVGNNCECFRVNIWVKMHGIVDFDWKCSEDLRCSKRHFHISDESLSLRNQCEEMRHPKATINSDNLCLYEKGENNSLYANCQKLNLTSVPQPFNRNITDLYLERNKIERINLLSFQNYSALQYLDLSLNRIHFIQQGTFVDLKNLNYLNMSFNSITVFIQKLPSLIELDLSNNPLVHIHICNSNVLRLLLQNTTLTEMQSSGLSNSLNSLDASNSTSKSINMNENKAFAYLSSHLMKESCY